MGKRVNTKISSSLKIPKKPFSASSLTWIPYLFFPLLVFIIYSNTLTHGFALDDFHTFLFSNHIRQGIKSIGYLLTHPDWYEGSGYRPVASIYFAFVYQCSNGSAQFLHIGNVLLYSILLILIYTFVQRLIPATGAISACIATLLFAVHPLHTEVVSNIKSADELLAGIFQLASLLCYNTYLRTQGVRAALVLVGSCCLAMLAIGSKESSLTLLGLIVLVHVFVSPRDKGKHLAGLASLTGICVLCTSILCILEPPSLLRVSNPLNNALLLIPAGFDRFIAALAILGKYLGLLCWPVSLRYEYGYNVLGTMNLANPETIVGISAIVIAGALTLFAWIRKHPFGLGLAWFFISISMTSNIFFLIGATMAERFVFIPSLGICLFAAHISQRCIAQKQSARIGIYTLIICLATFWGTLSAQRATAWKDNDTLFHRDGLTKSGLQSATAQASLGNILLYKAQQTSHPQTRQFILDTAITALRTSIIYYSHNYFASGNLAIAYDMAQQSDSALVYYRLTRMLNTKDLLSRYNCANIFFSRNQLDSAQHCAREAHSAAPHNTVFSTLLADIYAVSGSEEEAIVLYDSILAVEPTSPRALKNRTLARQLLAQKPVKFAKE